MVVNPNQGNFGAIPQYQSLGHYDVNAENPEETPEEQGVLIHVVPESGKTRWNHVKNLDSFFIRVYYYHQNHGFTCIIVKEVLELVQFVFIVLFSTFLIECVDYSVLFNNKSQNGDKVTIEDAIIKDCVSKLDGRIIICLLVSVLFWVIRFIRFIYDFFQYLEIRSFYNIALKIDDRDLDNMTWHDVQKKLQDIQKEEEMCIHKKELTELDIYNRILRFQNYMVAMVNKSLLPLKLLIPVLGEAIILTRGLKYNLEFILFWGPGAPFQSYYHLREDYKKVQKRFELSASLSKRILFVGIANFLLCPLILLWQILYTFYNYGELIKREPGALGMRRWSLYSQVYLRHFNELDHELKARLNRGYRPASKYMSIFTSPLMAVFAQFFMFVFGAVLAVMLLLAVFDEDVLTVEHVLTVMTCLGAGIAACRVFIPDDNVVWCPERLLQNVLAHINYLPDYWRGQAHTYKVRDEFAQLFQYKAVYALEEILSPVLTPFILCFCLRKRSLDIVDFYRNYTVEVAGVGDVCSFAQLDLARHGNPLWQISDKKQFYCDTQNRAEDGKTELSLVHFTHTNPSWKPPMDTSRYLISLREQIHREAVGLNPECLLYQSVNTMSSFGGGYTSLANSVMTPYYFNNESNPMSLSKMAPVSPVSYEYRGGVRHAEGPLQGSDGLLSSQMQTSAINTLGRIVEEDGGRENLLIEMNAANMSLSTIYLHQLYHNNMLLQSSTYRSISDPPVHREDYSSLGRQDGSQRITEEVPANSEHTPLLMSPQKTPRHP